jgi:signal peptidase I
MEPTLSVGQRVLVDRLASPHVGAIFVFHPPVSASAMICANLNQGVGGTGFAQQDGQACDRAVDKPSNVTYIKRIVAGPGDRLSIVNGHAILNGKREPDSYINPCDGAPNCDFPRTIVIPPGHWFMMGDNRGDSDDSRYWGPVPTSWLIGQAFFTYWPPDRIGTL